MRRNQIVLCFHTVERKRDVHMQRVNGFCTSGKIIQPVLPFVPDILCWMILVWLCRTLKWKKACKPRCSLTCLRLFCLKCGEIVALRCGRNGKAWQQNLVILCHVRIVGERLQSIHFELFSYLFLIFLSCFLLHRSHTMSGITIPLVHWKCNSTSGSPASVAYGKMSSSRTTLMAYVKCDSMFDTSVIYNIQLWWYANIYHNIQL